MHSTLAHEQIVAMLRGFVGSRRKAPIVTEPEPLLDIPVHTQDICIPLGIEDPMPVDAAVAAADRVIVLRGPIGVRSAGARIAVAHVSTEVAGRSAGRQVAGQLPC